ncbi:MAG: NUDIX hydrolase [Acidobacteria bacterium]|nr:NUDIX hydrolase [Acidobacteriota bacterium]
MKRRDADTLSQETLFEGRFFNVTRERVRLPHGRDVSLDIVRHPGSVILLPMPDPDHVILVRQYRHAVNRWLWELPAGSRERGEEPESAARRECHEEVGLLPTEIVRLGTFYPTPGYCDEEMVFLRLGGLARPRHEATVDEDEDLEPKVFSVEEARELVRRGEIVDMKTALGLTLI